MQREMQARLEALPGTEASFIEPMECLSVSKLPEGSQWIWEIKLDGYRALAVNSGTSVTLLSRRRKSLSKRFPLIVEALGDLPAGTVLDGELVAIDEAAAPTSICCRISVLKRLGFTTTFSICCVGRIAI
jgi:ATP-dependent DNA ligase